MSKKLRGFTLIELVVVIIILGILAVYAAPKFINLQSDARISALNGLKGAIHSNDTLYFAAAAIEGEEKSPAYDTPEGISLVYGIVHESGADMWSNQAESMDLDKTEWAGGQGVNPDNAYVITFASNMEPEEDFVTPRALKSCYLRYSVSVDPTQQVATKTLTLVDDDC
ncbi:type II secretion system protein [Shewanella sp. 10N.7]|uniref:type II secretion system protein n=1 Tax=Shewanella sp. 10N.7 TaxID=2885093 RepID=UPI002D1FAEB5|nr:prepilin-type N-terminal cleavage/methylation domain-containing protein [Shewanella sp. 10N.7]